MPYVIKQSFEEWKEDVNEECLKLCSMPTEDLPDFDFQLWYRMGKSAKTTAKQCIKDAETF